VRAGMPEVTPLSRCYTTPSIIVARECKSISLASLTSLPCALEFRLHFLSCQGTVTPNHWSTTPVEVYQVLPLR